MHTQPKPNLTNDLSSIAATPWLQSCCISNPLSHATVVALQTIQFQYGTLHSAVLAVPPVCSASVSTALKAVKSCDAQRCAHLSMASKRHTHHHLSSLHHTTLCCPAAEAPTASLLSNPKTLSTIQKVLEGQLPGAESAMTNGAPANGNGPTTVSDSYEEGQLVEVKFRAMKPGKYSLQLLCMSGTNTNILIS